LRPDGVIARSIGDLELKRRPISINAVSVITIIMSLVMTVVLISARDEIRQAIASASPLLAAALIGWGIDCTVVMLVAGIAVFLGKNWGRWLLAIAIVLAFIARSTAAPKSGIIPLDLVLIYFLFTPTANAFFRGGDVEGLAPGTCGR
jgi:hypothetical protein